LKKLEASAGMPKILRAFSIPMTSAASDTMRMKGNMMRVSSTASAALAGLNPGANAATSCGENTMPAMQISDSTTAVSVATLFARRQAASWPPRATVLLKVVTKAVDRAPSANRSRSRLGMRKAAVKASISAPPPNSAAYTCSRTSPRIRLQSTARLTTPAARVLRRSARCSACWIPGFIAASLCPGPPGA